MAEVTPVGFSTIGYRYFIVYAVINFALILPGEFLAPFPLGVIFHFVPILC